MSRTLPYACDHCGDHWGNPISAAMCCDPPAFGDHD